MEGDSIARIIGLIKGTLLQTVLVGSLFALLFGCPPSHAADSPTITQNEPIRRTQQLLDAYASGDRGPFQIFIAADAMFFDDSDMDKKALIESILPLPAGYSGSIRIEHAKARFAPRVAILVFDAIETETVFGQELHAQYHFTDTRLFRDRR
jgi:hypothetical protein